MEIYQTSFRTNDNNHTTEEANLSSSPREWDDSLDGRCCTSESNISHMSTIFMRKRDENSSSSNGDAGISRIGLNEGVEFEWNIDPRKGSLHITGALETTTTLTNQNDLEVEVFVFIILVTNHQPTYKIVIPIVNNKFDIEISCSSAMGAKGIDGYEGEEVDRKGNKAMLLLLLS
mmetsp:Transcript_37654/g.60411  ORF Transcript_37654/g.60411 Transcript_37654/m.60411 type:complete len:175 (+) Transcript_37654:91-615(+)